MTMRNKDKVAEGFILKGKRRHLNLNRLLHNWALYGLNINKRENANNKDGGKIRNTKP